ncbi:hypothetical protein OJAV_G00236210 [Oryzias javanicus]|uniref:Ig-like domain-containing protein n=1 Tax=Oryzias javanicus TaxID=123683 RepID=A0A3S2NNH6_ORYJA|nr:hypothetical protein OJAV_G00236210 [Oryzias javanicus]
MLYLAIYFVLVSIKTASSETHSLIYIYTGLSRPVNLSGIHEFIAMSLLDNREIDYYDSSEQKKVPKQKWMKEKFNQEYWDNGTEYLKEEEKQFKILIDQKKPKSNETHVLQWMHGCKGEEDEKGILKFKPGLDIYNYDGNYFHASSEVPRMDAHNEKECFDWMKKFLVYSTADLKNASVTSPPDVLMFATRAKEEANIVLTCLATGFYPKNITMEIKRNGRVLSAEDGLVSTGVRPNDEDTYQRRDHVEILRTDSAANYTCKIVHKKFSIYIEKIWDRILPLNDATGATIGGVVGVLVFLIVLCVPGVIVLFMRKQTPQENPSVSLTPAISSELIPLINLPGAVSSPREIPNPQRTPHPSSRSSMSYPPIKTYNKTFYSSI